MLVLATVLVDLVAVLKAAAGSGGFGLPPLSFFVVLCLPMSQVCLLAAWAALGRTPAPWRAVGLILPLALWSFIMGSLLERPIPDALSVPNRMTSRWTFLLLLETAGAVALLGIARAAGLHVTAAADRAQTGREPTPRRLQFSLLYLFGWLTAAAMVLAGLGYTFSPSQLALEAEDWRHSVSVAAINVGMLLAVLYAALGTRHWLLRWLVALVAMMLGAGVAWLWLGYELLGAIVVGCTAAWIMGSLAVVRVAGYRLAWRRGSRAGQPPGRAGG